MLHGSFPFDIAMMEIRVMVHRLYCLSANIGFLRYHVSTNDRERKVEQQTELQVQRQEYTGILTYISIEATSQRCGFVSRLISREPGD